jgi:hypothetical protein
MKQFPIFVREPGVELFLISIQHRHGGLTAFPPEPSFFSAFLHLSVSTVTRQMQIRFSIM